MQAQAAKQASEVTLKEDVDETYVSEESSDEDHAYRKSGQKLGDMIFASGELQAENASDKLT